MSPSPRPELFGYLFCIGLGLSLGWLFWTESGRMVMGVSRKKLKKELKKRMERLE